MRSQSTSNLSFSPLPSNLLIPSSHTTFFLSSCPEDFIFQQEGSMDRKYRSVFGDVPCCCFTMPSSVKHGDEVRGSGLGPERGKARNHACFPCPSDSVFYQSLYGPGESVCLRMGKSSLLRSLCSPRPLILALAVPPPTLWRWQGSLGGFRPALVKRSPLASRSTLGLIKCTLVIGRMIRGVTSMPLRGTLLRGYNIHRFLRSQN